MAELTEKDLAEIDKIKAEAEVARATVRQLESEVAFNVAQAHKERLDAELKGVDLVRARRNEVESSLEHQRKMASDKLNNVYRFYDTVTQASVKRAMEELVVWDRLFPGEPLEIILDSPGGAVIDGNHLFDFIRELRDNGHQVTIVAYGFAASMGGILLQAADKRVMGKEAVILIHQIATLAMGKIGEIEDEVELVHMLQKRVLSLFAERSAEAFANGTSEVALTADQFENGDRELGIPGWNRKDWWLTSEDCLRFGIVDEVRLWFWLFCFLLSQDLRHWVFWL